jgi:ribosomal protein S12 methylthiotransferase accessory factor YcaO
VTGLKLRDDAYYVPTSDGILILTPHGEIVLTGRSIFQWVDRLAPYLDGRHTLAELTAALPADRKTMTERVVNALREGGVVVETGADTGRAHLLTGDEQRLYRREIDFLGSFGSSGQRSFQACRDSVAVLAGAGRMLAETVRAALGSGIAALRVAVTDECPADLADLADLTDLADLADLAECGPQRRRDPRQRITAAAADLADEQRLADLVADAGIVVYASDRRGVDRARALDRACTRAGVPFVSAILAGDHAWLGPFGPTADGWPGWLSAWRRLHAVHDAEAGRYRQAGTGRPVPGTAADGPVEPRGDPLAGAAPTVLANQLVREVVRLLSGTVRQTAPARMARVDMRSLCTESHPFLPHPFSLAAPCQARADLTAAVGRLRAGEPLHPEEFSRRMIACLEPRLGVLSEVTERDFAQIPLAVAQVRVSDPVLLLDSCIPLPVVTGAGLSLAEARRAAVLRGLAAYGSLMVDPRRLHIRADTADPRTGDPEEDLSALRAGQWRGLVWGHRLADGRPHELAAAAVFPALRGTMSHDPPPGAAAGYGWQEAVRGGLIGQCRRLTLAEIGDDRRRFSPIEWDEVPLDARGDRYRSTAKITGAKLDVYDVTGSPRVPTLAFCLDDVTVAYASGFSFGEALRDGLGEVLLAYQARADREAGYAPASVPPLPEHARRPGATACPAWSTDAAGAAARLARLGWDAVAVPLDHDPGVTGSIMPYLVNVVVTHG